MSLPNYTCSYSHYYLNSAKASLQNGKMMFRNPTQSSPGITQYTINEIQADYSFYNVRAPYNRMVYYQEMGADSTKSLTKEIVMPPGNYSITEMYAKFIEMFNSIADETGWVLNTLKLQENTNKCFMEFRTNGNLTTGVKKFPNIMLGFGMDSGLRGMAERDEFQYKTILPGLPDGEYDAFYSIFLWMFGRQVPSLKNKDIVGKLDMTAVYDPLVDETILTYVSPTIPQASFDCYLYLISEYMNNFDQTIYEDVTDPTGETDLDITGANISDIWIKIPCSYYNFGDRIWYWPRTPYTFNGLASNQNLDVRVVDQFNRPVNMNQGNFNIHMVMYFSRDTNFI